MAWIADVFDGSAYLQSRFATDVEALGSYQRAVAQAAQAGARFHRRDSTGEEMTTSTDTVRGEGLTVIAFHNIGLDPESYPWLYTPSDQVVEVFRARWPASSTTDPAVCEAVFRLLNVGDDPEFTGGKPDQEAVAYRTRGNRALSIGDVVALETSAGRVFYAVARVGFDPIEEPAIVHEARPGTQPLPLTLTPAAHAVPTDPGGSHEAEGADPMDYDQDPQRASRFTFYHRIDALGPYTSGDELIRVFAGEFPDRADEIEDDASEVRRLMMEGDSLTWFGRDDNLGPDPRIVEHRRYNRRPQLGDVIRLEREEESAVYFALDGDLDTAQHPSEVVQIPTPSPEAFRTTGIEGLSRYLPE